MLGLSNGILQPVEEFVSEEWLKKMQKSGTKLDPSTPTSKHDLSQKTILASQRTCFRLSQPPQNTSIHPVHCNGVKGLLTQYLI